MRYVLPWCLAYDHVRGRIGHRIILLSFVRLRIQKMIAFEESLLGICDSLFASLFLFVREGTVCPTPLTPLDYLVEMIFISSHWCPVYLCSARWLALLSTTPDTAVAATTGVKPQPTLEQRNLQACPRRNLRFLLNTKQSQSNSITWVASLKM